MKKITLAVLVSFLTASGLALASQSGEEKRGQSMMEHMMNNEKGGEDMMGMMKMMGQMSKMMDQCSSMMESMEPPHDSEGAKEGQKQ
jgi:hypothetical protein